MAKPHKPHVKLNLVILPVLIGILIIFAILFPYSGWLTAIIALSGIWLFATLSITAYARNMRIKREMRFGWTQVGDVLEDRIILENNSSLPMPWVQIIDHSTIPDQTASIGLSINQHAANTWHKKERCTRRGLFRIGPTSVKTADVFGIYSLTLQDDRETNILVMPPVIPLPQIMVAAGGRTGDGKPARQTLEQSVAINTVRDYQPADPLNRIHWGISARRNKLTSKTFDNTPTSDWWIALDADSSKQVGSGNRATFEIGIILAASLLNKGITENLSVGLMANTAQPIWHPPLMSNHQLMQIMRDLAVSEAGDVSLDAMLTHAHQALHQSVSLVIITANVSTQWLNTLLLIKARGIIPTVLLLDPSKFAEAEPAQPLADLLIDQHISCFVITPEMLGDFDWEKQAENDWEWRVSGYGKAVPIRKPKDLRWRNMS